jgi:hypothetical protein
VSQRERALRSSQTARIRALMLGVSHHFAFAITETELFSHYNIAVLLDCP